MWNYCDVSVMLVVCGKLVETALNWYKFPKEMDLGYRPKKPLVELFRIKTA